MKDVANTALLTLKCHIEDAKEDSSILNDRSALKTYAYLDTILDNESKGILNNKVRKSLVTHTALRAKKYDDYVRRFLLKNPDGVIVNIGCGLDHRFERIDNGKCRFIDLDFPDIIDIKKNLFPPGERYKQISKSVFDFSWFDKVPDTKPTLLLAEGVFMYCQEEDVKSLFQEIHQRMRKADIAFEVFSSKWLKGWRKWMVDIKLRMQLKFGKDAAYRFGIADSNEIETWSAHYEFIEDWSYFDVKKTNPKDSLRKIQWTVYYTIH